MRPWFTVGISAEGSNGRTPQEDADVGVGRRTRQELAWEAVPGPGHSDSFISAPEDLAIHCFSVQRLVSSQGWNWMGVGRGPPSGLGFQNRLCSPGPIRVISLKSSRALFSLVRVLTGEKWLV